MAKLLEQFLLACARTWPQTHRRATKRLPCVLHTMQQLPIAAGADDRIARCTV